MHGAYSTAQAYSGSTLTAPATTVGAATRPLVSYQARFGHPGVPGSQISAHVCEPPPPHISASQLRCQPEYRDLERPISPNALDLPPQAATTAPTFAPGYVTLPGMPTVANGGILTTAAGAGWSIEFWAYTTALQAYARFVTISDGAQVLFSCGVPFPRCIVH